MANTTGSKIWVVDTATAANVNITDQQVFIKHILFYPSANSDDLVLQDGNGTQIIAMKAGSGFAADAQPYQYFIEQSFKGLRAPTVDGTSAAHIFIE